MEKGVVILFWRDGIELLKKFKVGNVNGSYFKRAPKEPTKVRRDFWLAIEDWDCTCKARLEGATKGLRTFWLRLYEFHVSNKMRTF